MANHRRSRLTIIFFKKKIYLPSLSIFKKHHEKTTAKTRWIFSLESLKSPGKALCKGFTQAKNGTFTTREKGNGTTKTPPWDKYSDEAVDPLNIKRIYIFPSYESILLFPPFSSLKKTPY